jgi:hypothetical protein
MYVDSDEWGPSIRHNDPRCGTITNPGGGELTADPVPPPTTTLRDGDRAEGGEGSTGRRDASVNDKRAVPDVDGDVGGEGIIILVDVVVVMLLPSSSSLSSSS